jgi:hypothetical protein
LPYLNVIQSIGRQSREYVDDIVAQFVRRGGHHRRRSVLVDWPLTENKTHESAINPSKNRFKCNPIQPKKNKYSTCRPLPSESYCYLNESQLLCVDWIYCHTRPHTPPSFKQTKKFIFFFF